MVCCPAGRPEGSLCGPIWAGGERADGDSGTGPGHRRGGRLDGTPVSAESWAGLQWAASWVAGWLWPGPSGVCTSRGEPVTALYKPVFTVVP